MRMAISTYRPASSWMTALLLTLVVTAFGLFAQYRVDSGSHGRAAVAGDLVVARADGK